MPEALVVGVNTGDDAVSVARTISNQTLRDDTLSKIAAAHKHK